MSVHKACNWCGNLDHDGNSCPKLGRSLQESKPKHGFTSFDAESGYNLGFKAGYQAHAAASQPVKIEDIPEEWKDGRNVDLFVSARGHKKTYRFADSWYDIECDEEGEPPWIDSNGGRIDNERLTVTHAMLPPTINTEDS